MAQRAVFLDRDGTVIEERNYLADPDQVVLIGGAVDALRRLHQAGWKLVIVTNQSGIARGMYTEADFRAVQDRMEQLLAAEGVVLDGVYHCPHHPDFTGPCACRKPGPGMYQQAARELGLDPSASVYVGDRRSDVQPAEMFAGRGFLVLTGYGEATGDLPARTRVVNDLAQVADVVLAEDKSPLAPQRRFG